MMLCLTLHMQDLYNIYIQELVSIHMYFIYCTFFPPKNFFSYMEKSQNFLKLRTKKQNKTKLSHLSFINAVLQH